MLDYRKTQAVLEKAGIIYELKWTGAFNDKIITFVDKYKRSIQMIFGYNKTTKSHVLAEKTVIGGPDSENVAQFINTRIDSSMVELGKIQKSKSTLSKGYPILVNTTFEYKDDPMLAPRSIKKITVSKTKLKTTVPLTDIRTITF